jgi:hypothetical protein
MNPYSRENQNQVSAAALAQAEEHDAVIFGEWALIKLYVTRGDTWQEELIGELQRAAPRLIVVAWHNPAAVLRCETVSTFLTSYGNTRSQVEAIVAVLTGEQSPGGRLPIKLGGEPCP